MSNPDDPLVSAEGSSPAGAPTMGQTAARVGGAAIGMFIWGYVERYLWRLVRPYLPATIIKQVERAISRFFDNLIWGCVFSVFFFAVFSCAVLGTVAIVVYAVVTS